MWEYYDCKGEKITIIVLNGNWSIHYWRSKAFGLLFKMALYIFILQNSHLTILLYMYCEFSFPLLKTNNILNGAAHRMLSFKYCVNVLFLLSSFFYVLSLDKSQKTRSYLNFYSQPPNIMSYIYINPPSPKIKRYKKKLS